MRFAEFWRWVGDWQEELNASRHGATSSTTDSTAADPSPAVTPDASASTPDPAATPAPPIGPDSSGFYCLLDKTLQFAPNEVHAPDCSLSRLDRERLPLPQDGWQWFDTAEAAHAHHGLELPKPEAQPQEQKPGQPQLPRRKQAGRGATARWSR